MFERAFLGKIGRGRSELLLLSLLLTVPLWLPVADATAQEPVPDEMTNGALMPAEAPIPELEREVDSLLERFRGARRLRDSARAVARAGRAESWQMDTTRVGPFTLIAPVDQLDEAERLLAEVWEGWSHTLGEAADRLGGPTIIWMRTDARPPAIGPEGAARVTVRPYFSPAGVRSETERVILDAIRPLFPEAVDRWGGIARERAPAAQVFRRVAVAPSVASRRCLNGALEWCWEAMGVTRTEEPWVRWYEPSEWLHIVRTEPRYRLSSDPEIRARIRICVQGGADACLVALRARVPEGVPPLGQQVRSDLLLFALEQGGRGALGRLLQSELPGVGPVSGSEVEMVRRLEAASGLDAETLMARWLADVLVARPDGYGKVAESAGATLLWFGLMALLSTRSTRWRLG